MDCNVAHGEETCPPSPLALNESVSYEIELDLHDAQIRTVVKRRAYLRFYDEQNAEQRH